MFGRSQQPKDAVDVNEFIVSDSMQGNLHIGADLGSPVPSVEIPDDAIIDADYAVPTDRKRLKKSQLAILGVIAVFAVGGVASIFVSPQAPEQNPIAAASQAPQVVPAPEPATKLPPGLADPDQVQPPATIPGPITNAPENTAPAAPDSVGRSPVSASAPVPAAVPSSLTTAAAPSPIITNSPVSPTVANGLPAAIAPAIPQVSEPKAQPAAPAPSSSNPVAAQIAEAQKLAPVTQPVAPAAQPKAAPAPVKAAPVAAQAPATPTVQQQAAAPVVVTPKATPPTAAPAATDRKPVAVAKAVAPNQPKQATSERENSEEGIKRLVTTSAESFGLQSIQEGAITLEGRRGNGPQRLHVGDRLPSGEQILRIDARSMTLVTDRSVIRLN